MPLVPIETALAHLRADAGDEDALIALYLEAAEQAAADYLNRQVYPDAAAVAAAESAGTAGKDPMIVNAAVKSAILLTLGHLHTNREDVVAGVSVAQLPSGARSLLRPHRRMPGL